MRNNETFLPCLIDRLKDDEPFKKSEAYHSGISPKDYKLSVIRDLEALLNTSTSLEKHWADMFKNVSSSVLNYGINNFTGMTLSHNNAMRFQHEIYSIIRRYEPRIIPDSLIVNIVKRYQSKNVFLELHAQLWMTPFPEELHLRTSIEIDNYHFEFDK